jgi:hypothetical protein
MFGTMWISFRYLVDSCASKDDLRSLKQLRGVNEMSNGDRKIFKHYKHVGVIRNNIITKMSRMIGW